MHTNIAYITILIKMRLEVLRSIVGYPITVNSNRNGTILLVNLRAMLNGSQLFAYVAEINKKVVQLYEIA